MQHPHPAGGDGDTDAHAPSTGNGDACSHVHTDAPPGNANGDCFTHEDGG